MHLRNFELEEPAHSSALTGLGLYWDLHAYAVLVDVHYRTIDNSVELHWRVPDDAEHPPGETNAIRLRDVLCSSLKYRCYR